MRENIFKLMRIFMLDKKYWNYNFTIVWALVALCIVAHAQESGEQKPENNPPLLFPIIPVTVEYNYAPHYFLQWIEGHPQYSMIEAVVDANEPASVQIILTEKETYKHVFYVSSALKAKSLQTDGREAYETKIDYKTSKQDNGDPVYGFAFRDKSGQPILWRVTLASQPSDRGAGLTPLAAVPGLRLDYRDLGTAVGEGTAVQIGDKLIAAAPWPQISSPPYFVAYHGSVTIGRHSGAFLLKTEKWRVASHPGELKVGETWVLNDDRGRNRTFKITARESDVLTINEVDSSGNDSSLVSLTTRQISEKGFALRSMKWQDGSQKMQIAFNPELSLEPPVSGRTEVSFSIDEGKNSKVISGTVSVERLDEKLILHWQPKSPDWAKSRMIDSLIKPEAGGYTIETIQGGKK